MMKERLNKLMEDMEAARHAETMAGFIYFRGGHFNAQWAFQLILDELAEILNEDDLDYVV